MDMFMDNAHTWIVFRSNSFSNGKNTKNVPLSLLLITYDVVSRDDD